MPAAATLRKLERVFGLLAWGWFGLGTTAILGLCAIALLSEHPPAPERFLAQLGVLLGATLVPTIAFRMVRGLCHTWRARVRSRTASRVGPLVPFEDSTLGS